LELVGDFGPLPTIYKLTAHAQAQLKLGKYGLVDCFVPDVPA